MFNLFIQLFTLNNLYNEIKHISPATYPFQKSLISFFFTTALPQCLTNCVMNPEAVHCGVHVFVLHDIIRYTSTAALKNVCGDVPGTLPLWLAKRKGGAGSLLAAR